MSVKKMNAKEKRELEQKRKAEMYKKMQEDRNAQEKKEETAPAGTAEAEVMPKREKSYPKAAGLKSTFTLPTGELLMTSFGKGSEALIQKRIVKDVVSDVQEKNPAFSVVPVERQFDIQDVTIFVNQKQKDKDGKEITVRKEVSEGILSDDPRSSKKLPGQDLIGAKDALEQRYFGQTFADNIHIQLIYRILDIKKTLAIHANNIVYTLDNLAREEDTENTDFVGIGYIGLKNSYAKYCDPTNPIHEWAVSDEKKQKAIQNIENSRPEFEKYLKNDRLAYYGHAFFEPVEENERYRNGLEKLNEMPAAERQLFRKRIQSLDEKKRRKEIIKLAPEYRRKSDKEIYYIIALISDLRQCILHDLDSNRAWIYNLEQQLPADAAEVLNGIYAEKVNSLNDFVKNSAKSNFRLLFDALGAVTDAQKSAIAVDFYKFSVRKIHKNTGFSVKLLRESMIDAFVPEYRTNKSYDSVRGKLYQLWDFLIWNYYDKNQSKANELVAKLRTEVKREKDEKSPIYDAEAALLWPVLKAAVKKIAGTLIAVTKNKNDPGAVDIKTLKLDDYDRKLVCRAIDTAVDEHGRRIRISEDVSYFSKLIYLSTLFLDGKEINDLLTTLVNTFDEIESFYDVLKKAKLPCDFLPEYSFFRNSGLISRELRDINSFARMTTETVSGKQAMFMDAAMLLGFDDTEEAAKEYLENYVLNKNKLPKKTTGKKNEIGKPDTGFRNFIISNVIESDRFRYVVRYGNPKKLRAVMQNEAVVKFVLNDLPPAQIDRYCANCLGMDFGSKEKKIDALTQCLKNLRFKDFEKVEQSANAARNRQKAQYQGMLSLYLNVLYQLIKNMVYINSRYALAFAKREHDRQLLNAGSRYFSLTKKAISEGKLNRRATEYLSQNLNNADEEAVKSFRDSVDHLNAVRNMNEYIGDLRAFSSYYGIYHYVIQRALMETKPKDGDYKGKIQHYFSLVAKYKTYCKDFVKALNVPFGYNLPRYKNLSVEGLFDKNRPGDKKESLFPEEKEE